MNLSILNDYDWEEAFGFASQPEVCIDDKSHRVLNGPFSEVDVAIICGMDAGDNDGPDWIIWGKLNDGRWFYLEAGCDYTGWECSSSGRAWVASDVETIILLGMNDKARERFNIAIGE